MHNPKIYYNNNYYSFGKVTWFAESIIFASLFFRWLPEQQKEKRNICVDRF